MSFVKIQKTAPAAWLMMLAFTACTPPLPTNLSVSITSPAVNQPVTGTVQVQVAVSDMTAVRKATLYARSKGSIGRGVPVGTSSTQPFVISWYTPALPNQAALEIYADVETVAGSHAVSEPVAVTTSNVGSPTLNYLTAYTLPAAPTTAAASLKRAVPAVVPLFSRIVPPLELPVQSAIAGQTVRAQASASSYLLDWTWQPVPGATGYRVWQASEDLVGPYANVFNQLATAGSQRYNRPIPEATPGTKYYGVINPVTNGAEGGVSNADDATFLAAQALSTPADGATAADGRPNLAWDPTPGATGYLWYVSRKPQATATPGDWVCWSGVNSIAETRVLYPSDCPKLTGGRFYWWVAGVAFDARNQADAFTFSPERTINAP